MAPPPVYQKILILKIGAMGDVLMTTPFVRALAGQCPGGEIHYLVGRHSAPVLRQNPHIARLVEVPDEIFYQKKVIALFRLFWKLRKEKYTRVVVLHRSLFHFLFARALSPRVIGHRNPRGPGGFFFGTDLFPDGTHHVHAFLALLAKMGLGKGPQYHLGLDFPLGPGDRAIPPKSSKTLVALNPGGGGNPGETTDVRQWPLEKWVGLGQRLLGFREDLEIAICGGPGDKVLAGALVSALASARVENRAGLDDLVGFRKFVGGVGVFVTGDTGGMHVAAAAGVPVVALFGPTDPGEKAPLEPPALVVWEPPPCAPCYRGKFPGCHESPRIKCLRELSVESVFRVVSKVLTGP